MSSGGGSGGGARIGRGGGRFRAGGRWNGSLQIRTDFDAVPKLLPAIFRHHSPPSNKNRHTISGPDSPRSRPVGALSAPPAPIQVERGFDAEPAGNRKRTHDEMCKDRVADRAHRQRRWLQRHSRTVPFGSWRPKKVHRVKSKQWLRMLDNQFRGSIGLSGLAVFRPGDSQSWASPFSWPYTAVAMDLGSDGNSGYHAMERTWSLNCDQYNDQSHGVNCDWSLMLGAVGARSMWILMLISWNMPFGPRRGDDLRLHQMRDCLKELYTTPDPNQVPLFGAFRDDMVAALKQQGVELPGVDSVEVELWGWLRDRATFGMSGRRASMCRFIGSVPACLKNTPNWAVDDFERTYCCLQMDGSRKLSPLAVRGDALEGLEAGSTAAARASPGRQSTMQLSDRARRTLVSFRT